MENKIPDKFLYLVREAAGYSGIPETSITKKIRAGEIYAERKGRNYYIPKKELQKLLMITDRDAVMLDIQVKRELEMENQSLRTQLNLLKNILSSAYGVLDNGI